MFVRDFIHVDQPFEVVAPRFVSDTSWLAPIAAAAAIRCELGPVRARADGILVPLWLIADRSEAGLPDLTGDLEVAPVGAAHSLIALGATYPRPAPEPETLRRVERAAEAGVRSFLNGIAAALVRPVDV